MIKRLFGLILCVIFVMSMYGCIAVVAGAAGAGTAVWISGKLIQEVSASLEKTVEATKFALTSLKLDVHKETVTEKAAQIMSSYYDGRTVWIDVHRISQTMSKVAVRVGARGDREAARKIFDAIVKFIS
jgi:hypothetical protein